MLYIESYVVLSIQDLAHWSGVGSVFDTCYILSACREQQLFCNLDLYPAVGVFFKRYANSLRAPCVDATCYSPRSKQLSYVARPINLKADLEFPIRGSKQNPAFCRLVTHGSLPLTLACQLQQLDVRRQRLHCAPNETFP